MEKRRFKVTARFIIVVVSVLLLIAGLIAYSTMKDPGDAKIQNGVSIAGVDVSGMDEAGATKAIQSKREEILSQKVSFTVDTVLYEYTLEEIGVVVHQDDAVIQAMNTTRARKDPEVDIELDYALNNDEAIVSIINKEFADFYRDPVDAKYTTITSKDESALTTSAKIEIDGGVDGYQLDIDDLVERIKAQVDSKTFETFEMPITYISAKSKDDLPEMTLLGQYTTSFAEASQSGENRMYNIWKISDLLNGVIINPGERFSVNDHVGPRSEELGWKLASGIENGKFTDQPGGGICQVSTTMYNAAIRAEMKLMVRLPHSIPSSYVPRGLDATISTGGPDFVVRNDSDSIMIFIVKCDVPNRKITFSIYGNYPRDYTLDFQSIDTEITEPGSPVFEHSSELEPGTYRKVVEERNGYVSEVYKYKYDFNGNLIEKEYFNNSTYKPISARIEIATDIPIPAEGTTYQEFIDSR